MRIKGLTTMSFSKKVIAFSILCSSLSAYTFDSNNSAKNDFPYLKKVLRKSHKKLQEKVTKSRISENPTCMGGVGGASAGFYFGKILTHIIGHGAIQVVAICTGPGYWLTMTSLEAVYAPQIEAASNVVGLGTGVIGGAATGPV